MIREDLLTTYVLQGAAPNPPLRNELPFSNGLFGTEPTIPDLLARIPGLKERSKQTGHVIERGEIGERMVCSNGRDKYHSTSFT